MTSAVCAHIMPAIMHVLSSFYCFCQRRALLRLRGTFCAVFVAFNIISHTEPNHKPGFFLSLFSYLERYALSY